MTAEQSPFVRLFETVEIQMSQLTTTVGAQGIAKIVENFDGSKPKNFKNWIKSIEKYATLTKTPKESVRLVAYQSSHGPAKLSKNSK